MHYVFVAPPGTKLNACSYGSTSASCMQQSSTITTYALVPTFKIKSPTRRDIVSSSQSTQLASKFFLDLCSNLRYLRKMGADQSIPDDKDVSYTPPEMTESMEEVLNANTYQPGDESKYPYFLVQLNEDGELPYGDDDILMSDCIAAYITQNRVTHIIAQTHGWNTPRKFLLSLIFY